MWNPFKRRGGQAPQGPAPGPAPAAPPAGAPAPKRGVLGRLFGRKPKPAPAPAAPPAPPPPQPPAAPAGEAGAPPEGGEPKPERTYPSALRVSASGTWKISDSLWHGTASGTLTGAAVKVFLDAMEAGDTDIAVYLIAEAYDDGSGFADNLDLAGTSVDISYG